VVVCCVWGALVGETRGLHVSGVAEVDTTGVGALIRAVLQIYDTLAGPQLVFGEVSSVLVSGFGSQEWSGPFGVQIALVVK
jgi:hypothetical protein